ncbi:unnamed protein product [Larinioides sclopetarius]
MREDKYVFYRFLKARNFDLKKAEDMLRKTISWRKEFKVDSMLTDYKPQEVLVKYFPYSLIGFDKEGFPVRYVDFAADEKGIFRSAKKVDLVKYGIFLLEKDSELLKTQSQKLGKPITKVRYICNFAGVTLSKATNKTSIELLILGIGIFQDNYPEYVFAMYIINASIYYSLMFSVAKTVVATEVLNKFHSISSDKQKEVLLEVIDENELPAFLGGNKTDPDGNPQCNSFIIHARQVPERYFLKKSEKTLAKSPEAKKLIVNRFSKESIFFEIKESDSYLEWEFETKNRDIGFGLYFKESHENDSKPMELLPKQRIDTTFGSEVGIFKCEHKGVYIVVFDNSYSWIYSKELYYKVKITRECENGIRDDTTFRIAE